MTEISQSQPESPLPGKKGKILMFINLLNLPICRWSGALFAKPFSPTYCTYVCTEIGKDQTTQNSFDQSSCFLLTKSSKQMPNCQKLVCTQTGVLLLPTVGPSSEI